METKLTQTTEPKPDIEKRLAELVTVNEDKPEANEARTNVHGLFELLSANEVINQALNTPDPKQLIDPFITEGELIVCFADTGVGKTVFAVQCAIKTAKDGHISLYIDLELSRKQFQKRYTGIDGKPYKMPDNLFRLDFARLKTVPDIDYQTYFLKVLFQQSKPQTLKLFSLTISQNLQRATPIAQRQLFLSLKI